MSLRYRVKTKRSGVGDKAVKFHAIPISSGIISTRQLAKDLTKISSLSEGDVYATLIGLSGLVEQYLHQGYGVKLEELGIFTLSGSSEGYDTPEECTPRRVKAKKICFRADKSLKSNLKFVTFEREKVAKQE